jgi:hypothetical protein
MGATRFQLAKREYDGLTRRLPSRIFGGTFNQLRRSGLAKRDPRVIIANERSAPC